MSIGARQASARIAAKSAVKIRAALAASIDARRVYTQYMDTRPPITNDRTDDRVRARAWAMNNVKLDLAAYKKSLARHYADMYVLGQSEALENMAQAAKAQKGPVATARSKPKTNAQGMPIFDPSFTINWDAWTPGNEGAAALLDQPGGLKKLLGDIDIQAKGISDYSHDLLGTALADGIAQGKTPVQIANDIRDSLSAPERALTIAITEGQRAKISANLDSYQANGVEQIEWTVNDPDDADCLDNEGQIVNLGDEFRSGDTQPPVHPNCQCDVIPVMPDLSGTPEYTDEPVDDSEMAVRADLEKYSEDQPRDSHGRFGSGSGESKPETARGSQAMPYPMRVGDNAISFTPRELEVLNTAYKNAALDPIAIRMTDTALGSFVKDERMKSVFETGKNFANDPGRSYIQNRNNLEKNIWKVPEDATRPIYGYMDTRFDNHNPGVDQYGNIRITLKDDVANRTTMTAGDSLNDYTVPVQVTDAREGLSDKALSNASQPNSVAAGHVQVSYYEAQIHGGVSLSDVKSVDLGGSRYATNVAYDRLIAAGIEVKNANHS